MAVRTARAELRRLGGMQRAAEAEAAAAADAAARAEQVCGGASGSRVALLQARRSCRPQQRRSGLASFDMCNTARMDSCPMPPHPLWHSWLQDKAAVASQKRAGWLPKVGQSVFVPRLGKRAKVVAVDAASGTLTLQAGMIKVAADAGEVRQP